MRTLCRNSCQQLRASHITEDEIANALGVEDSHDLPNVFSAACRIVSKKVHEALPEMVGKLGERLAYVLNRTFAVARYLAHEELKENGVLPVAWLAWQNAAVDVSIGCT